jgi:hypothetical protein
MVGVSSSWRQEYQIRLPPVLNVAVPRLCGVNMKIYLVVGSISDYEGTYSWNVKAFTDKETDWISYRKACKEWISKRREIVEKYQVQLKSQYDPNMSFDKDAYYEVEDVEIE